MTATLADHFAMIRVISLPYRHDRRRQMTEELAQIGTRIDQPPSAIFDAIRPADAGPFESIGAHGCFESHLGVLAAARDADVESVLILEDDFLLTRHGRDNLGSVLAALAATDWSIFYGGWKRDTARDAGGLLVRLDPADPVEQNHFVAFRRDAIALAVPYLQAMRARPPGSPEGGPMHVDGAYSWLRAAHPELATYAAAAPLAVQRPSRTDIAAVSALDRIPGIGRMTLAVRAIKARLRSGRD